MHGTTDPPRTHRHRPTKPQNPTPSTTPDDYDARLGDQSFRVVNNQDIVARVPRATRSPSLIECVFWGECVCVVYVCVCVCVYVYVCA